jgi:hypothetical protein
MVPPLPLAKFLPFCYLNRALPEAAAEICPLKVPPVVIGLASMVIPVDITPEFLLKFDFTSKV